MPYNPRQRKNNIREIQRYLQGISYFNDKIPLIIPDGFFGKETENAVRAFQREYRITETGTVNHETWNKIVFVYRNLVDSNPLALDVFPSRNYIIQTGDTGMIVYIIQSILYAMHSQYDNFPAIQVNGIYDNVTYQAVKFFQNLANLQQTGKVNNHTWNALVAVTRHLT
ncbi:MAG: peptidoglycan-binding protein [Oscillospiraceae bacterium]|nr:peptidoglycan-binding protein [Oscillospiraceae bacterium]